MTGDSYALMFDQMRADNRSHTEQRLEAVRQAVIGCQRAAWVLDDTVVVSRDAWACLIGAALTLPKEADDGGTT